MGTIAMNLATGLAIAAMFVATLRIRRVER